MEPKKYPYMSWLDLHNILWRDFPPWRDSGRNNINIIDALIEAGVLMDDVEYRHTTGGVTFGKFDALENHYPFYEYIKSKPTYQVYMI